MSCQEFELDLADGACATPSVEHKLVPSGDFERNGDLSQVSPKSVILSVTSGDGANLATSVLEQRGSSGIASSGRTFSLPFRFPPRRLEVEPSSAHACPSAPTCSGPSNV